MIPTYDAPSPFDPDEPLTLPETPIPMAVLVAMPRVLRVLDALDDTLWAGGAIEVRS